MENDRVLFCAYSYFYLSIFGHPLESLILRDYANQSTVLYGLSDFFPAAIYVASGIYTGQSYVYSCSTWKYTIERRFGATAHQGQYQTLPACKQQKTDQYYQLPLREYSISFAAPQLQPSLKKTRWEKLWVNFFCCFIYGVRQTRYWKGHLILQKKNQGQSLWLQYTANTYISVIAIGCFMFATAIECDYYMQWQYLHMTINDRNQHKN